MRKNKNKKNQNVSLGENVGLPAETDNKPKVTYDSCTVAKVAAALLGIEYPGDEFFSDFDCVGSAESAPAAVADVETPCNAVCEDTGKAVNAADDVKVEDKKVGNAASPEEDAGRSRVVPTLKRSLSEQESFRFRMLVENGLVSGNAERAKKDDGKPSDSDDGKLANSIDEDLDYWSKSDDIDEELAKQIDEEVRLAEEEAERETRRKAEEERERLAKEEQEEAAIVEEKRLREEEEARIKAERDAEEQRVREEAELEKARAEEEARRAEEIKAEEQRQELERQRLAEEERLRQEAEARAAEERERAAREAEALRLERERAEQERAEALKKAKLAEEMRRAAEEEAERSRLKALREEEARIAAEAELKRRQTVSKKKKKDDGIFNDFIINRSAASLVTETQSDDVQKPVTVERVGEIVEDNRSNTGMSSLLDYEDMTPAEAADALYDEKDKTTLTRDEVIEYILSKPGVTDSFNEFSGTLYFKYDNAQIAVIRDDGNDFSLSVRTEKKLGAELVKKFPSVVYATYPRSKEWFALENGTPANVVKFMLDEAYNMALDKDVSESEKKVAYIENRESGEDFASKKKILAFLNGKTSVQTEVAPLTGNITVKYGEMTIAIIEGNNLNFKLTVRSNEKNIKAYSRQYALDFSHSTFPIGDEWYSARVSGRIARTTVERIIDDTCALAEADYIRNDI